MNAGATNPGYENDEMDKNSSMDKSMQKTPLEKSLSMPDMKEKVKKRVP